MRLIRSICQLKPHSGSRIVTIGTFDGVHRGHQALIQATQQAARRREGEAVVLTFEPHPVEYFSQGSLSVPRLTRFREKVRALAKHHSELAIFLNFNQQVAELSASEFLDHILINSIGASHIVVGEDFRFGARRQGDVDFLKRVGESKGVTIEVFPPVLWEGERISSTRIREALLEGRLDLAEQLLNRPYSMQGRVRYGNQLGRTLGFATANIFLHRALSPVQGIFAVYVKGLGPRALPGAAYVGTRPTVDGVTTLLEVHLLDFDQDIYGASVEVIFCKKLRSDARFSDLAELKMQIAADVANARHYFRQQGVL